MQSADDVRFSAEDSQIREQGGPATRRGQAIAAAAARA
jgi:hypothetical protein